MLITAFITLGTAVLLGSVLAILHLHTEGAAAAPWPFAALHGILAIGGLSCLVLGLGGPPRGVDQGATSFGIIAVALIGSAALIGVVLFVTHLLKRRLPGILIGIHATLAVGGFVILTVYVFAS
jgi:hypothetical protein